MSLRLGLAVNSLGLGGVTGACADGAGVGVGVVVDGGGVAGSTGVGGVVGGATWVGAGGAAGAGTAAAVVAGRFGHPTRKRVRTSRGATRNKLPRRCDMFLDPPFRRPFTRVLTGFEWPVICVRAA